MADEVKKAEDKPKAVKKVAKKDKSALPPAKDGFVRISADAEVRIKSKAAQKFGYTPGKKDEKEKAE